MMLYVCCVIEAIAIGVLGVELAKRSQHEKIMLVRTKELMEELECYKCLPSSAATSELEEWKDYTGLESSNSMSFALGDLEIGNDVAIYKKSEDEEWKFYIVGVCVDIK